MEAITAARSSNLLTGRSGPLPRQRGGVVLVDADDQDVAEAAGLLQQLDVAGVEEVEDPVGEDDLLALPAPEAALGEVLLECLDLGLLEGT